MKAFLSGAWNLTSPIFGRGINFLILPVALLIFEEEDFVKISFNAMLVTGISLVASLGSSPKVLNLTINGYSGLATVTMRILFKLSLLWSTLILILLVAPIESHITFTGLSRYFVILTIIEGIIIGFTQDILISALQGKRDYTFINTLGFIGILLLGPMRIMLASVLTVNLETWICFGIASRLLIFLTAFFRNSHKANPNRNEEMPQQIPKSDVFRIFGAWNFVILVPSFVWIVGNMDRMLVPTALGSAQGAAYQIAYQCASLLGLLCGQLILMETHSILSKDLKTFQNSISKLVALFRLALFSSLPFLVLLFQVFYRGITSRDAAVVILLAISQFSWAIAQINLVYVMTSKRLTLAPIICTILGIGTQLLVIRLTGSSNLGLFLPILAILGFSIIAISLAVINPAIGKIYVRSFSLRVSVDVFLVTVAIAYILKNGEYKNPDSFILLCLLMLIHVVTNRRNLIEIWRSYEFRR